MSNAERKATEGYHEDNRRDRLLCYYGLTKPQLEPLFRNAETPPEEYTHKDDFAEDASKKIEDIMASIVQPLADLPPAAKDARKKLKNLLTALKEREQHYGPDATITQLKLSAIGIEPNIGQFVGVLINQRKRYNTELRRVLSDNQSLRDKADYRPELVTATQASRALRRTRLFVTTIRQRGGVAQ